MMRQIREALRLHLQVGLTYSEVARALKLSKSAVGKYVSLARVAGVDCTVADGLSDDEFEARLYRPAVARSSHQLAPNFGVVHQVPLAEIARRRSQWCLLSQVLTNIGDRLDVHDIAQRLTDPQEVDKNLLFHVAAGVDSLLLQAFYQFIQHTLQCRRQVAADGLAQGINHGLVLRHVHSIASGAIHHLMTITKSRVLEH